MLKALIGDMFASQAQTLVNTVNCVGVMGKGVALEFKKRFPAMFDDYLARCGRKQVRLGEPYLYRDLGGAMVVNFPTKDHWRSSSRLADIEVRAGLFCAERHGVGYYQRCVSAFGLRQWRFSVGRSWTMDVSEVGASEYRHRDLCALRHAEARIDAGFFYATFANEFGGQGA
jgi:hypothetical protein